MEEIEKSETEPKKEKASKSSERVPSYPRHSIEKALRFQLLFLNRMLARSVQMKNQQPTSVLNLIKDRI